MKEITVEIGAEGLNNSWQGPFPKTTPCVHCGASTRPACTVFEGSLSPDSICELHDNKYSAVLAGEELPEGEGFWLHDDVAFAIYLCPACCEATCLYNQA